MKSLRAVFIFLIGILPIGPTLACPVCEKQQPEVLKGIAHGAGPDSQWDYVIVLIITAIVAVSLFYCIKWIVRPGEKGDDHIKRTILKFD